MTSPNGRAPILKCIAFVLALGLLILTGCARTEEKADLIIINGPEPESLDPALITGQADGRVVLSLFEGLTRFHPETATPVPGLAERWDISDDGRIYTFHLRTNAAWSTGEPINAEDFVYSWRRVLDPRTACEYSALLFYVKNGEEFATGKTTDPAQVGLQALDARTLRVELLEPTPFFLDLCALPTLCVVPKQALDKYGDRWLTAHPPPVSGAYQLEFWRLNDKIRVRKNPFYWDAANTRSAVVDLLPCSLAATALNLYESGQADIVWDKELVPTELVDVLRKRDDFHRFDYLGTYFIRINVTRKPFDDVRVRKALGLVIDKARLVEKFTKAGEKVAHQYVPPVVPGYTPPPGLGRDPGEARRLLAEAGYPGGKGFPRFDYLYNTGKAHEQIAIELQEMWQRELGIHVELRQQEMKVYFQAQSRLDYDTCRGSWIGDYNDPNTFLDMFMSNNGNNRTGWKSPRYDALLREANAQKDPRQRERLLQAAESLLIREEVPIVPLYIYAGLEYYDAHQIEGVYQNPRSEHPLRSIRKVQRASVPQAVAE
jgi:oligopeptide transport system substrate-binding protein